MSLPGIMTQEFSVPPMADKLKNKSELAGYSYKYIKADMDDLAQMSDLELIMTRGVDGTGEIVVVERSQFTFMDKCFQIVQYLQKNPD